jgi:hypothetical protein
MNPFEEELSMKKACQLVCVVAALVAALCLMVAAPAGAVYTHVLTKSIGEAGSGDGQVSLVPGNGTQSGGSGVAVDDVTHDVYVADTGNHRIDEFSAAGTFIRAWGWGVADGKTEALQTCTSGCHVGLEGAGAGELTDPTFIAVDNSNGPSAGDVYVANQTVAGYKQGVTEVVKFTATGGYLSRDDGSEALLPIPGPFGSIIAGVAVDTSGNLWVYAEDPGGVNDPRASTGDVFEFAQDGSFLTDWHVTGSVYATAITVSPTQDVYLSANSGFNEYTSTGGLIGQAHSPASGTAANTADGEIYLGGEGAESIERILSSCYPVNSPCAVAEDFGSGELGRVVNLAVDSTNDTVYGTDAGRQSIAVFGRTPDAITEPPTARTSTTAVVSGSVDPDNTPVSECRFDYVSDAEYSPSEANPYAAGGAVPCDTTPSGAGATTVHAEITGLTPGAIYHFRLQATNANGTTFAADETIAGTAPVIRSVLVADVTSASAALRATINPAGGVTTYRFEYGPTTDYGTSIPIPDASIGSGTADVTVGQRITGLLPGSTYHYRLVGHNPLGTTDSPDQAITTQPSGGEIADTCPNAAIRGQQGAAALPDCRAYEQVSPPERNGAPILGVTDDEARWQAAPDGNSITYTSAGVFADAQTGNSVVFPYLSARSQAGWSTRSLLPPQAAGSILPFIPMPAFSTDLSKGVLFNGGGAEQGQDEPALVPGEPAEIPNLFLRDNDTNTYQLINVTPGGTAPAEPLFQGNSPDLSHIFFVENAQLTPNALPAGQEQQLYEWSGGAVHLAGILPDGSPARTSEYISIPFARNGEGEGTAVLDDHAISDDGSRVFFHTQTPNAPEADGDLYVRENGTRTTQLDASRNGGPGGGGLFAAASSDGSVAYFVDDAESKLTSDTVPGSGLNLYSFDTNSSTLTDRTPVAGAEVQGVVGASEDGSYLYFVADAALAPGASRGDCTRNGLGNHATSCNLYVLHGGVTTFIASLNGEDLGDWDDAGYYINHTAVVSPNGQYLAFQSLSSLTGYDNLAANGERCGADETNDYTESPRAHCTEVFLFDAATGKLSCASCNPSGAAPIGSSTVAPPTRGRGTISPEDQLLNYQTRYLSDRGRLFFGSLDALVPRDVNDQWDVYEYEPDAIGSCDLAQGCISEISSGESPNASIFRDASLTGEDVFFTTTDQLVAQDGDQSSDMYDAKVDGGIASQNAVTSAACEGEACKSSMAGQASEQAPGSTSVSGQGNLLSGGASTVSKPTTKKAAKQKAKSKPKKKRRSRKRNRRSKSRRPDGRRVTRNRGGAK